MHFPSHFPDSNFSLQLSLTRQECKLETSYCKRRVTTCRTCSKLVASNSLQTIAKTEYADEPQIRTPDNPLPKPGAFVTQPAGLRLRRQITLIYRASTRFILKCLLNFINFLNFELRI
ncbi:hypothetical protein AVEN_256425-1 [Araneus ventricosus]|uniref:Uncharacterized protein n=1 Tax=Araneus ventricosus TaxID=182803 RepID=A0A4Y2K297_ARAVE|nr:hypothetical protein AVEN_256425-1 [Araneus ventricosus]